MPAPFESSRPKRLSALIVFCLASLTIAAVFVLPRIKIGNDAANWLPDDDPRLKSLHWFNEQFPQEDRVILTFEGGTLGDPRLTRLAEELKARAAIDPPSGIDEVTTPEEVLADLLQKGIPRDQAIERLRGVLLGQGDPPEALIALSVQDKDIASDETLFRTLYEAAEAAGISEAELRMGGRRIASAHLDHEVLRSAWNSDAPFWNLPKRSPFLFTLIVALALAFVVLRDLRMTLLVLGAALSSAILSVAIVAVTGGTLNMVLVVMPTLLLVLNLSGGVHIANYWQHAAARNPAQAAAKARSAAALPTTLACSTTAIGLGALCASPLLPIRQFGFYTAIGCGVSLVILLWGIPALLELFPPKVRVHTFRGRHWERYGHWITRHHRKVLSFGMAGFALATAGLWWFQTETKIIRFFPDHHRVLRDYRYIEGQLGGIIPVDVVVQFTPEAREKHPFYDRMQIVRDVQNAIDAHPDVSGSLSLADFAEIPEEKLTTMQRMLGRISLRRLEEQLHEGAETGASRYVSVASSDLEVDQHRTIEKGDEIWRIGAQVAVTTDLNYAVLNDQLASIAAEATRDRADVGYLVTGMVPLFLRTQDALLESLIKSFGLAFLVIACMMTVMLRDIQAGLILMIPNAFPVLTVFGLLSWIGYPLDIGMMITASIVLGIAVDDTLHLITWYRQAQAEGDTTAQSITAGLKHCGRAMIQTSVIISVGLLMLFPAELLLIRRFSWLMALLVFAALIADLLLLPALLAGPLAQSPVSDDSPDDEDDDPLECDYLPAGTEIPSETASPA